MSRSVRRYVRTPGSSPRCSPPSASTSRPGIRAGSRRFYTRAGQRARLSAVERDRAAGLAYRFLILEGGELAGEVVVPTSCAARSRARTSAIGSPANAAAGASRPQPSPPICAFAFGELELHRLEAGTLCTRGSQIVLDHATDSSPFGVAPDYLRIAGAWWTTCSSSARATGSLGTAGCGPQVWRGGSRCSGRPAAQGPI